MTRTEIGLGGGGRGDNPLYVARLPLGLLYPYRLRPDLMLWHEKLDSHFNVLPATTRVVRPIAAKSFVEACAGVLLLVGADENVPPATQESSTDTSRFVPTNAAERERQLHIASSYDRIQTAVTWAHEFGMPIFGVQLAGFPAPAPDAGLRESGVVAYTDSLDPEAMKQSMESYLSHQANMRQEGL